MFPFESVTVNISFTNPARTHTPIQFPAVLLALNPSVPFVVVPASVLVCCTNAIFNTATALNAANPAAQLSADPSVALNVAPPALPCI